MQISEPHVFLGVLKMAVFKFRYQSYFWDEKEQFISLKTLTQAVT